MCYKNLFKDELDQLQQMDIITELGVDEMAEWCNSFVLVPKTNGKVRLCSNLAQLNQALIRPIHRGLTLNDILPKLNNVRYLSITDASSGYHNLKLDEKSSYLTTFACQFGRYRYKWLPFRVAPMGDMFQCKLDEIFNDMPNVFGIMDNILVIGYDNDGTDQDAMVHKVLQRCKEVNLKLNKEKCHFRCTSIPFFEEVILRRGVQPDPQKIKALLDMPPPNNKKSSKHSWGLLTISVNFLQALQKYVIYSKNWHQVRQHGHGMHLTNHYLSKHYYL